MTLHSVANFKNRSAAVCIEASFVGYPTTAGNQKLFLPLIARPRFPIGLIWTSACDAGVIAEEFTPIGGWECRARNLSRQRGGSRGNGLGRSSANGYSLPQELPIQMLTVVWKLDALGVNQLTQGAPTWLSKLDAIEGTKLLRACRKRLRSLDAKQTAEEAICFSVTDGRPGAESEPDPR